MAMKEKSVSSLAHSLWNIILQYNDLADMLLITNCLEYWSQQMYQDCEFLAYIKPSSNFMQLHYTLSYM